MVTRLLRFFQKKQTLEDRIKDIQRGNEEERNNLIKEYIPYIQKTASQQLNKYIEIENNDIYSISLIAFNEAIDKYNPARGSFLSFASMVIKSRIIDELRKENRSSNVVLNSFSGNEGSEEQSGTVAVESFEGRLEAKEDIKLLVKRMAGFNVTLEDLVSESPKHMDTRLVAIKIARHIFESEELRERLLRTRNLPSSELTAQLKVSNKILQRSRKFIIAIVLILDSNLDTMKYYISEIERGA